jgi:hypothetical protein
MYTPGDFSFHEKYAQCFADTYKAVSECKAWDFLENYEPTNGFIWSDHPTVILIGEECERLGVGHSGASFGVVMRDMQLIAKRGWDGYLNKISVL